MLGPRHTISRTQRIAHLRQLLRMENNLTIQFPQVPQTHPLGLTTLPFELLTDLILPRLDCQDLLSVSETCKTLYRASKETKPKDPSINIKVFDGHELPNAGLLKQVARFWPSFLTGKVIIIPGDPRWTGHVWLKDICKYLQNCHTLDFRFLDVRCDPSIVEQVNSVPCTTLKSFHSTFYSIPTNRMPEQPVVHFPKVEKLEVNTVVESMFGQLVTMCPSVSTYEVSCDFNSWMGQSVSLPAGNQVKHLSIFAEGEYVSLENMENIETIELYKVQMRTLDKLPKCRSFTDHSIRNVYPAGFFQDMSSVSVNWHNVEHDHLDDLKQCDKVTMVMDEFEYQHNEDLEAFGSSFNIISVDTDIDTEKVTVCFFQ